MSILFEGWAGLARTLAVGVPAYLIIILFLRLAGKRALAKINAYGLVVTVALGSVLATTLLSKDVPLAEGVLAIGTLLLLQFAIAWAVLKSKRFRRLVTQRPTLLLYRGRFLDDALRSERVPKEELEAAARSHGFMSLESIYAIVLETDGSFSVIGEEKGEPTAMRAIGNLPPKQIGV